MWQHCHPHHFNYRRAFLGSMLDACVHLGSHLASFAWHSFSPFTNWDIHTSTTHTMAQVTIGLCLCPVYAPSLVAHGNPHIYILDGDTNSGKSTSLNQALLNNCRHYTAKEFFASFISLCKVGLCDNQKNIITIFCDIVAK